MLTEFQSGDLQRLLSVSKERITHLGRTVGRIEPEIERVEGTGRSHRYSFRNAIQFACAHRLGKLGLNPEEIRRALKTLDLAHRGKSAEGLTVRGLQAGELFDPGFPLPRGLALIRVESHWPNEPTKPGLVKFAIMKEREFIEEEEELAEMGKSIFGYHVLRLDTIKAAVAEYAGA
jgi:hypothetical protein